MLDNFSKLTKEEINEFEKFVNSPYFNSYQTIILLFAYLKRNHGILKTGKITRSDIAVKVYGEKTKANDFKVRKLLSDFNKVFEEFLIQKELESNEGLKYSLLWRSYRKKGLSNKHQKSNNRKVIKKKKIFSKDQIYYHNELNNSMERLYSHEADLRRDAFSKVFDRTQSLDLYFVYQKLKNYYEILANEEAFPKGKNIDKTFYNDVMAYTENNIEEIKSNHPNIYIYYLAVNMFRNYEVKYFDKLQDYFKRNRAVFKDNLLSEYLDYTISYLINTFYDMRINPVNNQKLFEIYDEYFVKSEKPVDGILYNGSIELNCFLHLITIASLLEKYKWADSFIEKSKNYLGEYQRESGVALAKGMLSFSKGDYDDALLHLNKIKTMNVEVFLKTKAIQSQIYYERNEPDALYSVLENLNDYWKRSSKVSNAEIFAIKNFIKHMKTLEKIRNIIDPADRELERRMFRDKVETSKQLLFRKWFWDKLG